MQHFVTHRGGGQPYSLTKSYPHFQNKPRRLKIAFSCALAFVLSMFCFPNLSPLFGDSSSQSTITAAGYSENYDYVSIVNPSNGAIDPLGVNTFLKKLTGDSSINIFNYEDFFVSWTPTSTTGTGHGTTLNSAEICGNNNGKDILLDDGFMLWTPVFALNAQYFGFEVTLMQAYCGQYSPMVDPVHLSGLEFYDGYAPFYDVSYNTAPMDASSAEYPADMYGTSFMRSVVLGNGNNNSMPMTPDYLLGDGSDTLGYDYSGTSIYAEYLDYMFLLGGDMPLFDFPTNSPLQANPKMAGEGGWNVTFNDMLNGTSPNSNCVNYTQKDGYNNWAYDFLFLPGVYDMFTWNITENQAYYGASYYLRSTYGKGEAAYIQDRQTNSFNGLSTTPVYPYIPMGVRPVANLNLFGLCSAAIENITFDTSIGITKKSSTEYHILNFEGLKNFVKYIEAGYSFSGATIYLDNNINCKGEYISPIPSFNGTFDGQGHYILNFNSSHFIEKMTNGVVRNLYFLGWNNSRSEMTSLIGSATGSTRTTIENVYIDFNWTSVSYGSAGVVGVVSKASDSEYILVIQNVGLTGRFTVSSGTPAAFVGNNSGTNVVGVRIENSFYNGSKTTTGGLIPYGANGYAYLGGVYICQGTVKIYWTGFTASDWICSSTVNGGLPVLKQFVRITGPTASSVDSYLSGKSFTSA